MNKKNIIYGILAVVALVVVFYLKDILKIASVIIGILKPVLIGVLFALLLKTPLDFFENKIFNKIKNKKLLRGISLFLSFVFVALILLFFVYVLLPQIAKSMTKLIEKLPSFIQAMFELIDNLFVKFGVDIAVLDKLSDGILSSFNEILAKVIGMTPDFVRFSSVVVAFIANIFFAFTFAGYILFDKEGMRRRFERFIRAFAKEERGRKIIKFSNKVIKQFDNFFSGQVIEAIILGFMCFVGMLVLNIPYAPLVATIIAITAIIPLVGAFVGTIPGVILIMIESPMKALIFVIFIIILQGVEGNLIYPRVVGNKVELPPFFVLLALIIGGGIMGVVGIIVCVPLMSVVYREIKERVDKKLEEKNKIKVNH
ncbi:MAG: AI-2E family transporter [Clostridia bacterium]